MSWDEVFETLRDGTAELGRYEAEQLQAMYRVLSGDYVAPVASIEELRHWTERRADFCNLVEKATRRLTTRHRLYPVGFEPLEAGEVPQQEPEGYRRRYVCPSDGSCYSIGVRDSFAQWLTPVWMRFHRDTGDFALIRERIAASGMRFLDSGGHIWIPLDVPLEVSSEVMIDALVDQAQAVVGVVYGRVD